MTRSLWKIPYIDVTVLEDIKTDILTLKKKTLIYSRNSKILPDFLNKMFLVHNGKKLVSIKINENMIDHKFGEFAQTRTFCVYKKSKKKKK
jgi:small subunit ribosomal protein S19